MAGSARPTKKRRQSRERNRGRVIQQRRLSLGRGNRDLKGGHNKEITAGERLITGCVPEPAEDDAYHVSSVATAR